jgi:hypothetical protein
MEVVRMKSAKRSIPIDRDVVMEKRPFLPLFFG